MASFRRQLRDHLVDAVNNVDDDFDVVDELVLLVFLNNN